MNENAHKNLLEFRDGMMHEVGEAVQATKGALPSILPETPQWAAWLNYFREEAIPHVFFEQQGRQGKSFTVVSEYPPSDGGVSLLDQNQGKRGGFDSSIRKKLG